MAERIPVLAVVGPTAVGKSAYALRLAEEYGGEIVSGDSMQIYKGMDIGTAKASPDERRRIRHHMLDIAEIDEPFSADRFLMLAREAIEEIASGGKLPIVCGGTGLYIELLLTGTRLPEGKPDPELRRELAAYADAHGPEALHEILKREDPAEAEKIHPNNVKRVVRAIEICRTSGMTKTEADRMSREGGSPFDATVHFLTCGDRSALYRRIEQRVDDMFERGLENEVKTLCARGLRESPTASQAIGYKEFYPYLDGKANLESVRETLTANTRHYAKRQETWFRRMHTDVLVTVG